MNASRSQLIALLGVLACLNLVPSVCAEEAQSRPLSCQAGATAMARLELVFGMSRRDAPPLSDEEWQSFVDEEVTPRFPDGLTIFQGYGQWRNSKGLIAKENSRLLLIWYEPKSDSDQRIQAIREAYKARFKQESVLRADGYSCVSF